MFFQVKKTIDYFKHAETTETEKEEIGKGKQIIRLA